MADPHFSRATVRLIVFAVIGALTGAAVCVMIIGGHVRLRDLATLVG